MAHSLMGVARHEFGHASGLLHVLNTTDLMYPFQPPNFCDVIHTDDADGGRYELVYVAPFVSPIPANPQQYPLNCPGTTLNGIEDIESSSYNIKAYPNPFDQTITIIADMESQSNVKVELFNILGQTVFSNDYGQVADTQLQTVITTAGLCEGIYLLKVSVNNSSVIFKLTKN